MPSKKEMAALQAKHDALESKVSTLATEKAKLVGHLENFAKAKESTVTQVTSLESELKTSRDDASKLRGESV